MANKEQKGLLQATPKKGDAALLRLRLPQILALCGGLLLLTAVAGCIISPRQGGTPTVENKRSNGQQGSTLFVGPNQVDCVGVGPQKCLLVKETLQGEYQYFYDGIEGFDWEPGFEYELLVQVTEVDNPPADGSSLHYALIEVVAKRKISADK